MTDVTERTWQRGGSAGGRASTTPYEAWMAAQGLPMVRAYGITDLGQPEFGFWERLGCEAYFVQLHGMEDFTSMYVAQLPSGGATKRERHLYEKLIYILAGSGSTELEGPDANTLHFEWHEGSLFAIPLNTPHRLFAHGQPVRFAAITTAVVMFDFFHNEEFIYDTPFWFRDRFDGSPEYLHRDIRSERGTNSLLGAFTSRGWETNFVSDVREVMPETVSEAKRSLRFIQYEPAGNTLIAHESKYPSGSYMQAHYHGGGAVLMILRSQGYSLMWPRELGHRPFESGHGDQVIRVDWKPGSVFSPPTSWYHQHFNTGPTDALQLAFRYGSQIFRIGFHQALGGGEVDGRPRVMMTRGEGGAVIPYAEEDPEMARMFHEALARNGVTAWIRS